MKLTSYEVWVHTTLYTFRFHVNAISSDEAIHASTHYVRFTLRRQNRKDHIVSIICGTKGISHETYL